MSALIESKRTLVDLICQQATNYPDKLAFEYLLDGETQSVSITYAELDRKARTLAVTLERLDIAGERVLLLYPPSLDYITAFMGCQYAGAIAVPAYPPDITRLDRSMPRFMAIVNNSRPRLILTTSPILSMTQFLLPQYPELGDVKWIPTDTDAGDPNAAVDWKRPNITSDSLSFLQYTSGSTSIPKGVMLNHGNLMHQLEMICQAFDLRNDRDRVVLWLPFYHDMGLIGGILGTLYIGGTNTLMSPLDFLQRPLRWLQAITRAKATVSGGPNFAYELCARKIAETQKENLDLSSWEVAFNGAEPVRADTLYRFSQAFEVCGFRPQSFYPCYGLAEATLLVTGDERNQPPTVLNLNSEALARHQVVVVEETEPEALRLVGCGHTWLGQKIVIVDQDNLTPCLEDENGITSVGEIWVTGQSIAQGYWNRPEESERTFYARLPGFEGRFLRTGDLGFLKQGELFVTGRIKDMIIIDGLNHYPQDIEATVEKCHPAVRPGCSAAFSADVDGEEQLIVVAEVARANQLAELTLKSQIDSSPEVIVQTIRKAISNQHDLRAYQVILLKPGSVPKTSSGKIQRHASKAGYLGGTLELWKP